MFSSIET